MSKCSRKAFPRKRHRGKIRTLSNSNFHNFTLGDKPVVKERNLSCNGLISEKENKPSDTVSSKMCVYGISLTIRQFF